MFVLIAAKFPGTIKDMVLLSPRMLGLVIVSVLSGTWAFAAGYYNLGAFWKGASAPQDACLLSSPTFVQRADSGDGNLSAQINESAGNTLVAAVFISDGVGPVSISDTLGNTWTPLATYVNPDVAICGQPEMRLFYAKNILAGSNTVTASTSPAPTDPWVQVFEYSGVSATTPIAASSGHYGTNAASTAMDAGSLTVPLGGGLVFASFSDWYGVCDTFQPASGYTSRFLGGCYNTLSQDAWMEPGTVTPTASGAQANKCWVAASAVLAPACTTVTSPQPTIAQVLPWSGPTTGGTSITILGTLFDSNATVTVGGRLVRLPRA